MPDKTIFGTGDFVVYPTHGVGKILGIESQEIAGHSLSVFVVHFDKDRMTLRVPIGKAKGSGLRRLSTRKDLDAALAKLKGRSKARRTMGTRRRVREYAGGGPARGGTGAIERISLPASGPCESSVYAVLRRSRRVWAVASVHGEAERLTALHSRLAERLQYGDRI